MAAGRIVGLNRTPADFAPARVIDASGCIVLPGLVDLAARLREPATSMKACSNPKWPPRWPAA